MKAHEWCEVAVPILESACEVLVWYCEIIQKILWLVTKIKKFWDLGYQNPSETGLIVKGIFQWKRWLIDISLKIGIRGVYKNLIK